MLKSIIGMLHYMNSDVLDFVHYLWYLWNTALPNGECTDKVVELCSNLQFQENVLMFVVRTRLMSV